MKKQIFTLAHLVLLVLTGTGALAQSKIKDGTVVGSTSLPNGNAILELESNSKGFLLPRVTLTNTTAFAPLSAHLAGITVYNTATAGNVTPGYYYNDGAKWVRVADATAADLSKDAWVDDNANTMVKLGTQSDGSTARTIGTEFVIKDDGKVGIGTSIPTDKLHVETSSSAAFVGIGNFYAPSNTTSGNATMLRLGASGSTKNSSEIRYVHKGNGNDSNHLDISFYNLGGNAPLSVLAGGNVGIGTPTPSAKLEVNGTVEIATVNNIADNISYKPLIWNTSTQRVETSVNYNNINRTMTSVPSGDSATIDTLTGPSAYEVKVYAENGCAVTFYNKFIVTGSNTNSSWVLNHIAGMSQDGASSTTTGTSKTQAVVLNPLSSGCADGGNTTAFNYTLTVGAGTGILKIINNGNITRTYRIVIEKAFD